MWIILTKTRRIVKIEINATLFSIKDEDRLLFVPIKKKCVYRPIRVEDWQLFGHTNTKSCLTYNRRRDYVKWHASHINKLIQEIIPENVGDLFFVYSESGMKVNFRSFEISNKEIPNEENCRAENGKKKFH